MIKNKTIFTGDNLPILRGMDDESVDLIYLDPPFNSNRHYSAPIGSKAAGAEFKDAWTFEDTDAAWWGELAEGHESLYRVIDAAGAIGREGSKAYLIYMAMRLLELRRILKPTGSIYLHCDLTMNHYLKIVMDAIFGCNNFRNEVIWCYKSGGVGKQWFAKKHDTILFYSKSENYSFNSAKQKSYGQSGGGHGGAIKYYQDANGTYNFVNQRDWWNDIGIIASSGKERTGYPTQKPLKLLDRIIKASSNEGDVVLDPFCGSATTCIAAEILNRQWIGIDISPIAVNLLETGMLENYELDLGGKLIRGQVIHRTDIPVRDAPPRS